MENGWMLIPNLVSSFRNTGRDVRVVKEMVLNRDFD